MTQVPIMWQSFASIGRESSEIWRRKSKKKHHEHFIRHPVTPYGRPNKKKNNVAALGTCFRVKKIWWYDDDVSTSKLRWWEYSASGGLVLVS